MSRLPVHPRLARLVVEGEARGVGRGGGAGRGADRRARHPADRARFLRRRPGGARLRPRAPTCWTWSICSSRRPRRASARTCCAGWSSTAARSRRSIARAGSSAGGGDDRGGPGRRRRPAPGDPGGVSRSRGAPARAAGAGRRARRGRLGGARLRGDGRLAGRRRRRGAKPTRAAGIKNARTGVVEVRLGSMIEPEWLLELLPRRIEDVDRRAFDTQDRPGRAHDRPALRRADARRDRGARAARRGDRAAARRRGAGARAWSDCRAATPCRRCCSVWRSRAGRRPSAVPVAGRRATSRGSCAPPALGRGSFAELGDPAVAGAVGAAARRAARAARRPRPNGSRSRAGAAFRSTTTPAIRPGSNRACRTSSARARCPALGRGPRRADRAPAGAQRTRGAGDARSRELLGAALPGAAPATEPPLSQDTPGPKTARRQSRRRPSRRATSRDEHGAGALYCGACFRSFPDAKRMRRRRARLAARLGNRPALIAAGVPRPRNYAANLYPFRASSHFLYLFGLPLRGRGRDLRRRGVHAVSARRRARPGAVGGRAADARGDRATRPAVRSARWRACRPAFAGAPSRRCPRPTSRPASSRAACSAARSAAGSSTCSMRRSRTRSSTCACATTTPRATSCAWRRPRRRPRTRRAWPPPAPVARRRRCAPRWKRRSSRAAWAAPTRRSSRRTARSCTASATTPASPTAICCSPTWAPRHPAAGPAT